MTVTPEGFSSLEVASSTGLTVRQLQWWDEHGIFPAKRAGRNRAYSDKDIRILRVLAELRKKGIKTNRLRALIPQIRRSWPRDPAGMYLITDGGSVLHFRAAWMVQGCVVNMNRACYVVGL